jgi:signal transduction histidine kinase
VVMPAGQLLLSLGDQGARRWLLTLEVHQSLGENDPWRLSRSHFELLLRYPADAREQRDAYPDAFWPHERLGSLGLVDFGDDGMGVREWYSLSEPNAAELRAAMAEQSPMWALAKAITPDPAASLPLGDMDAAQRIGARQAGRAAAELGRTAAHELMNVLPLMENSLQQLSQLLKGTTQELGAASQMKQLGGNLDRLFRYADWFKQLGEGLDRPPERFGAQAMLEDAIQLANGGAIDRELTIHPELSLYGLRDRLVIALVNLLRNARQHGAGRVRVSARTDQQQLFIEVEDDGPGVPPERVPMVFVSSFSTRVDGTGQGLPLVKHIIEDEHQGSIGYSRSSLGGARFSIRLPV